jgi:hypothetical protein
MGCSRLQAVILGADSQLVRIEEAAFESCRALTAIHLPPLVEFVGAGCFTECKSLSVFTFSSPCRIRLLWDLPPFWSGLRVIPDSVEHLAFRRDRHPDEKDALTFSRESRLKAFCARASYLMSDSHLVRDSRCFMQVSTRSLKTVRSDLEFQKHF